MRMLIIIILIALLFVFLPQAAAFKIKATKFLLPGETFIATIEGDFVNDLKYENIFFYFNEEEIQPVFHLAKWQKKYFVWLEPEKPGNYSISVKNILYRENGILKGEEKKFDFFVAKTISSFYEKIYAMNLTDIETISLAILALSFDSSFVEKTKKLIKEEECWPAESCKVKDTALALLATNKTSSWLVDSQNFLDIGLWDIVVESKEQPCEIFIDKEIKKVNFTKGRNEISLETKNRPALFQITLNCSVDSAKIVHTYLGIVYEFAFSKEAEKSIITLHNEGCFGMGYRESCDFESTAYALFSEKIEKEQEEKAKTWLKNFALASKATKEKALAYYFTKSSELKEWLVNNQHKDGYWTSAALAEKKEYDIEATIWATFALNNEKGKKWLFSNLEKANQKQLLLSLFLIFPFSQIENIISISPAFFKTAEENITFKIKNKGINVVETRARLAISKEEKKARIEKKSLAEISFKIPKVKNITESSIEIFYSPKIGEKEKLMYNLTAIIISISEILANISFSQQEIYGILLVRQPQGFKIFLRNTSPFPVKNISITYSKGIKGILNITPLFIEEISPGRSRPIELIFESEKLRSYKGTIKAESLFPPASAEIAVNISFTQNISEVNITIPPEVKKTCAELGGKICSATEKCNISTIITADTGNCCVPPGECVRMPKGKDMKFIGFLMLFLAIFFLIIFFGRKMKKPKREITEIAEKAAPPLPTSEKKEIKGWKKFFFKK